MSFKNLKITVTPMRFVALVVLLATISILFAFTSLTPKTTFVLYLLCISLWFGYCLGLGARKDRAGK